MLKKTCELAEFKLMEEGSGSFSGYGSTFQTVDRAGEFVVKGAFQKSLPVFKQDGFIALSHDWQALPIATVADAYEDAKGLFIKADFHSTEEAQAARTVVKERLDRGKSVGLSIGYAVEDSEPMTKGLALKTIELFEVSLVTVPANPEANATRVKSVCGASNLPLADRGREWDASAAEKGVRSWAGAEDAPNAKYRKAFMVCDGDEAEFTSYKLPFAAMDGDELKAVPRGVFAVAAVLQGSRGGANISSEDRAGAKSKVAGYYARMRREFGDDSITVPWEDDADSKSATMPHLEPEMAMAAMQEAHRHLMGAVYDGISNGLGAHEIEPAFDEHKGACLNAYKALCSKPGMKEAALAALKQFADPPAGKADQQLDTLLADAQRCVTRQGEIVALRAREGRILGEDRRKKLADLAAALSALAAGPVSKILASETAEALLAHYRDRQRRREPAQAT